MAKRIIVYRPQTNKHPVDAASEGARRTLFDLLTLGIPRAIAEKFAAKHLAEGLTDAAQLTEADRKTKLRGRGTEHGG